MLAIVCPTFNQVSETFVVDHVHSLWPGNTVLVCQDGRRAERFGCPVLSNVISDYTGPGKLSRAFDRFSQSVQRGAGFRPLPGFADRNRLEAFLREHGVTVVLAEFGYSGALVSDVCATLGLPLFVYFRGHDATIHRRYASMRRRYQRMFRQAQGFIAESQFLADEVASIGCPQDRLHVVTSGMNSGLFTPSSAEPGRIIGIGRLVEMKAPHLTLQAFAKIAGDFPHAHLDLVGDGILMDRCKAVIAEHNLADRVTLHGYQSHDAVAELIGRASLFVQHSVTDPDGKIEGFPVAIAEAMASQIPVVSTRHSGIPEHVREGVTGFLVDEHDVDGMARAMARVLADPEAAQEMGRAARTYALEHLTRQRNHERMRQIMDLPGAEETPVKATAG